MVGTETGGAGAPGVPQSVVKPRAGSCRGRVVGAAARFRSVRPPRYAVPAVPVPAGPPAVGDASREPSAPAGAVPLTGRAVAGATCGPGRGPDAGDGRAPAGCRRAAHLPRRQPPPAAGPRTRRPAAPVAIGGHTRAPSTPCAPSRATGAHGTRPARPSDGTHGRTGTRHQRTSRRSLTRGHAPGPRPTGCGARRPRPVRACAPRARREVRRPVSVEVGLAAVERHRGARQVAGVGAAQHHHGASDVPLAVPDVAQGDGGAEGGRLLRVLVLPLREAG